MRKKVFSGIFALALLATAGWGVNKSMSNDVGLSDLALSNVEALANGESGSSDCATYCTPASGYTCIIMWPGAEGITCNSHRKK
jgi:hypothetical protein